MSITLFFVFLNSYSPCDDSGNERKNIPMNKIMHLTFSIILRSPSLPYFDHVKAVAQLMRDVFPIEIWQMHDGILSGLCNTSLRRYMSYRLTPQNNFPLFTIWREEDGWRDHGWGTEGCIVPSQGILILRSAHRDIHPAGTENWRCVDVQRGTRVNEWESAKKKGDACVLSMCCKCAIYNLYNELMKSEFSFCF